MPGTNSAYLKSPSKGKTGMSLVPVKRMLWLESIIHAGVCTKHLFTRSIYVIHALPTYLPQTYAVYFFTFHEFLDIQR